MTSRHLSTIHPRVAPPQPPKNRPTSTPRPTATINNYNHSTTHTNPQRKNANTLPPIPRLNYPHCIPSNSPLRISILSAPLRNDHLWLQQRARVAVLGFWNHYDGAGGEFDGYEVLFADCGVAAFLGVWAVVEGGELAGKIYQHLSSIRSYGKEKE